VERAPNTVVDEPKAGFQSNRFSSEWRGIVRESVGKSHRTEVSNLIGSPASGEDAKNGIKAQSLKEFPI